MKKILIANRGEIAVRIIRSCKELGMRTVAVHSLVDKESLHTKLADESVCIGPNPSHQSYLSIPHIMSAVEITGADAIHPGYGYLSEDFTFARICQESGITFIGPSYQQIESLGNKITAKKMAKSAGLQLLPGCTHAISSHEEALQIAKEIEFPVILKAASGGGGRGLKVITSPEKFEHALQLVQTESQKYFGSSDLYIEKFLTKPKHIEVQVMGDHYGNIINFGERECTIQRRNQKLLEESPAACLDQKKRNEICSAAVALAKESNYQSLGTIEFLYQDGQFYFIEMNTRIQVEHPVTEMITGVDLIKEQIQISLGKKIPYEQNDIEFRGHAIECRINAEDPETFSPSPGKIEEYFPPGGPGVRIDSLAYRDYQVPPYYDSLIAKLITHDDSRSTCIKKMQRCLKELKIEGIKTNIALHEKILSHPKFIQGDFSTKFLHNLISS